MSGWRWLFLVDGIISIGIAVPQYFLLPDVPARQTQGTSSRRQILNWRVTGIPRKDASSKDIPHCSRLNLGSSHLKYGCSGRSPGAARLATTLRNQNHIGLKRGTLSNRDPTTLRIVRPCTQWIYFRCFSSAGSQTRFSEAAVGQLWLLAQPSTLSLLSSSQPRLSSLRTERLDFSYTPKPVGVRQLARCSGLGQTSSSKKIQPLVHLQELDSIFGLD